MLALLIFTQQTAFSQQSEKQKKDSVWFGDAILAFNLQQTGFTNWAQGGESSISYGSVFTATADRIAPNSIWKNNIRLGFGYLKRNGFVARKNTDLIILTSTYGYDLNDKWEASAGIDFRSQFANGYKYGVDAATGNETALLVSTFLSPAYVQPSIGFSFKHKNIFSATISPLSNKITIVKNDSLASVGAFGVDPFSHFRSQMGTTVNFSYNNKIMENVTVKTNLLLFGDYSKYTIWDLNYDLFIDMKINKWLMTNFLLQLIYDDDIKGNNENPDIVGPAIQIRHVLNFGLIFRLIDKKKK